MIVIHWLGSHAQWMYFTGVLIYIIITFIETRKRKQLTKLHTAIQAQMSSEMRLMMEVNHQQAARICELEAQFIRHPPKPPEFNPVFSQSDILREILEEGRRGLAKKYHPDKPTGDSDKMRQINAVVDRMVGR